MLYIVRCLGCLTSGTCMIGTAVTLVTDEAPCTVEVLSYLITHLSHGQVCTGCNIHGTVVTGTEYKLKMCTPSYPYYNHGSSLYDQGENTCIQICIHMKLLIVIIRSDITKMVIYEQCVYHKGGCLWTACLSQRWLSMNSVSTYSAFRSVVCAGSICSICLTCGFVIYLNCSLPPYLAHFVFSAVGKYPDGHWHFRSRHNAPPWQWWGLRQPVSPIYPGRKRGDGCRSVACGSLLSIIRLTYGYMF